MSKGTKTEWQGLWMQREGVYSGYVLKKEDIPKNPRLIVRYNKFYKKDSNKPRFVYCFANGDAAKAITIKQDIDDYISLKDADEILDKIDELREVLRDANTNADRMLLPSESQAVADSLMEKAIELVEEITGEEWDFTYITWG